MTDVSKERHESEKSREVELLEELLSEAKASGEFARRYSYVSFGLTIVAIMIATMGIIFAFREQSDSLGEFAFSAFLLGGLIIGAFRALMRQGGWDS